jgi:3-hydroxyisobutyrate dehydrogenase
MSSLAPVTPPAAVGFIGLGNMGRLMAANLAAAGYRLVVHDVRREAAAALLDAGAAWADSPAAVARAAPVVCTSLPGPAELEAVFGGERGLRAGVGAGSLLLDFTTNAPQLVRRLAAELRPLGAAMLDAPVSGGVSGAASRRLTVQVGGDAADLARARPVLDAMADTVLHVGAIGCGNICKLMHNCAVFCADLALFECLTAGVKAGVDADVLIRLFQRSGIGRNHDLQVSLPVTVFRGDFSPRFALDTALKDMRLATGLAQSVGVPMDLAARCEAELAEARARGWGGRDHASFLTLQEERAGVQVRLAPAPAEGAP